MVNSLPEFLCYVVSGYLFVSVYGYFSYSKHGEDISNTIIKSISASFIVVNIFNFLVKLFVESFIDPSNTVYVISLMVFSVILAYAAFRIVNSKLYENMRYILSISRTQNENIWDDVIKPNIWVRIWLPNSHNCYLGQVKYIETHCREPIIALESYQYIDKDGNIVCDYSSDRSHIMLLPTNGFERIEVINNVSKSNGTPEKKFDLKRMIKINK